LALKTAYCGECSTRTSRCARVVGIGRCASRRWRSRRRRSSRRWFGTVWLHELHHRAQRSKSWASSRCHLRPIRLIAGRPKPRRVCEATAYAAVGELHCRTVAHHAHSDDVTRTMLDVDEAAAQGLLAHPAFSAFDCLWRRLSLALPDPQANTRSANSRPLSSTAMPASSAISRSMASAKPSPGSTRPPGRFYVRARSAWLPAPGARARRAALLRRRPST
jgi:hypothetical protein